MWYVLAIATSPKTTCRRCYNSSPAWIGSLEMTRTSLPKHPKTLGHSRHIASWLVQRALTFSGRSLLRALMASLSDRQTRASVLSWTFTQCSPMDRTQSWTSRSWSPSSPSFWWPCPLLPTQSSFKHLKCALKGQHQVPGKDITKAYDWIQALKPDPHWHNGVPTKPAQVNKFLAQPHFIAWLFIVMVVSI